MDHRNKCLQWRHKTDLCPGHSDQAVLDIRELQGQEEKQRKRVIGQCCRGHGQAYRAEHQLFALVQIAKQPPTAGRLAFRESVHNFIDQYHRYIDTVDTGSQAQESTGPLCPTQRPNFHVSITFSECSPFPGQQWTLHKLEHHNY